MEDKKSLRMRILDALNCRSIKKDKIRTLMIKTGNLEARMTQLPHDAKTELVK